LSAGPYCAYNRVVRPLKWVMTTLAIAALGASVWALRRAAFAQHRAGQRYEDLYYLPAPAWLPVLSLGYRQALADVIWIRSLVYFGEELGQRGRVKYVFAYTDAVLALDPDLRSAYSWVPTAAIYRPGAATMVDGLRAAEYLERAVARWPDDGELQWDLGSLLRFELVPAELDRVKKRALLERAAPHLEAAARLGAGPPWLALDNVDLLNKLGRVEQSIRKLEEMHGTVQDEELRREIETRLLRLRERSYVEAQRVANENFERERQRSYPYLSPSLFLLVGSKPAQVQYDKSLAEQYLAEPATVEPAPLDGE